MFIVYSVEQIVWLQQGTAISKDWDQTGMMIVWFATQIKHLMKIHSSMIMDKPIKIRYIIVVCFLLFFAWWAHKAFVRYWSQPLTTDISYRFGDNENGIEFPFITFCQILIDPKKRCFFYGEPQKSTDSFYMFFWKKVGFVLVMKQN